MKKATKQSRRTAKRKARQRAAWASFVANVRQAGEADRVEKLSLDILDKQQKQILMTGYASGWR